jgi:RNA polymerase sigma-70 factor (ECF subfamily)
VNLMIMIGAVLVGLMGPQDCACFAVTSVRWVRLIRPGLPGTKRHLGRLTHNAFESHRSRKPFILKTIHFDGVVGPICSSVTFFGGDSYIVRAKMVTRRPARKGSAKGADAGARLATGPTVDERVLVEAAQSDPAKFDALYELHFERVYAFVASRMRNRTTTEDVTSEVFHKALASLPNYEWRGVPFVAWLLRIAANAIVDHAKRAAREFPAPDDPPDPSAAPDLQASEMRAIEHRAQLFRLVGRLPGVQKQVVYERFVEQRSIKEIAQRLGKTAGAIKQLQLRAVQNLRAQMEGSHG